MPKRKLPNLFLAARTLGLALLLFCIAGTHTGRSSCAAQDPAVDVAPPAEPGGAAQRAAGNAAAANQQQPKPAAANERYWTTQWSFEDIDVGTLASRLSAVGIDLGLRLEGKVSVQFDVGIPLTSLRDGAKYRFDGKLSSPLLVIDGIRLRDFSAALQYRDGTAKLAGLRSLVESLDAEKTNEKTTDEKKPASQSGRIVGSGSLQLVPRGDVTAKLEVNELSISPITELIFRLLQSESEPPIRGGRMSGDVDFSVPMDSLADIAAYELTGKLVAKDLALTEVPQASADFPTVKIEDGHLLLESFTVDAASPTGAELAIRMMGDLDFPLDGVGKFRFQLAGDDVPAQTVVGLVRPEVASSRLLDGKLDVRAIGTGSLAQTLADSSWEIQGSIASPSFSVAGVALGVLEHDLELTPTRLSILPRQNDTELPAAMQLRRLECDYEISDRDLRLNQLDGEMFGGRLAGKALLPFDALGQISVDLDVTDLRPTVTLPFTPTESSPISATLSGTVQWKVPADSIATPSAHSGKADLMVRKITVGRVKVGGVQAMLSAAAGTLDLQASGELFQGKFRVATVSEAKAEDLWSDLSKRLNRFDLQVDELSLEPLAANFLSSPNTLSGRVSAKVHATEFERTRELAFPVTSADVFVKLRDAVQSQRPLSRNLTLRGDYVRGVFNVNSLVGDYAGGSLRASGRVFLIDAQRRFHPRADLLATCSRVDLSRGLRVLGPFADDYHGRVSGSVTLAGFRENLRVRGNTEGRDLSLYGVLLGNAHSTVAIDLDAKTKRWRVRFPSLRSTVGGGAVDGELALSSATRGVGGVDLESRWSMRRVDFFRLTDQLGSGSTVAHGEITGDLTLGGKSISSLDDLEGRFRFQLGDTRGAGVPGFVSISKFLGPLSLATERFEVGEAIGIIGRGILTLDEFWLGSDNALVRADGRFYLRSGRMDLKALIATGDYRDIAVNFNQLARRYALQALLPASAIVSVSELLRDRTLVVSIMGTLQSPLVRLRPVETFREEAVRFVLREGQRLIVGSITAGAVDQLGMTD